MMPGRSLSGLPVDFESEGRRSSVEALLDDRLVGTVTGFIEGRFKNHTFVTGGFGTGKSRAVGTAALAAAASGSRVARLEQGPLGISSFDDFLAAVDAAVSVSDGQPAADGKVQPLGDANERSPLVIIVEGLDQLVRQIRAADRPAFSELPVAPDGPLVVGTAILGVLPDEFAPSFEVLQTSPVGTVAEGVQIAVERALQHRVSRALHRPWSLAHVEAG